MAAVDRSLGGRGEPASNGFAVTPHDTNELEAVTRAVYVGGTGNLVVQLLSGETVTFSAVPAGAILPIRAKKITTATTATLILGLY